MPKKPFSWTRGLQIRLARSASVSTGHLCDIVHRRRRASFTVAKRLADAAKSLKIPLSVMDFLSPFDSKSPAMIG
jgi:hypothetical protein